MDGQLDLFDLLSAPRIAVRPGWYPPGTSLTECKVCMDCFKPIKWAQINEWRLGPGAVAVSHFWCRTRKEKS